MSKDKKLTTNAGCPVVENQNVLTAGPRGPQLLQDVWYLEKLAHFDREVIPERRMHAKGSGAYGTFTVTHDIARYTRAKIFSQVGKKTDLFVRFSTAGALLFADYLLGPEGQGILEKYHYGNGAKNYGFKKWRPEHGMPLDQYEKELERWEKLLKETGRRGA